MPVAPTAPSTGQKARAELRVWYLGGLRPRLIEAAQAGVVRQGAVEELDLQVIELLGLPEQRFASTARRPRRAV